MFLEPFQRVPLHELCTYLHADVPPLLLWKETRSGKLSGLSSSFHLAGRVRVIILPLHRWGNWAFTRGCWLVQGCRTSRHQGRVEPSPPDPRAGVQGEVSWRSFLGSLHRKKTQKNNKEASLLTFFSFSVKYSESTELSENILLVQ